MLKPIGTFFLVLIVIVSFMYDSQRELPKADVTFARADQDTAFHIGRSTNTISNGHIAVRVTGNVNDSTGVLSVAYESDPLPTYSLRLAVGPVDTVISGDFYAGRAKITYLHGGVNRGQIRMRAIFGFPPADWPVHK